MTDTGFGYVLDHAPEVRPRDGATRLAPLMSSARGDWRTPEKVWECLRAFGYDTGRALVDMAPVTFGTPGVPDSLSIPRWGEEPDPFACDNIFLYANFPYGGRGKRGTQAWIQKAREAACPTILLFPARTDATWFPWDADAHCFIKGRLRFVDPQTGEPALLWSEKRKKMVAAYAPFPCVVTLHLPALCNVADMRNAFARAVGHLGTCLYSEDAANV